MRPAAKKFLHPAAHFVLAFCVWNLIAYPLNCGAKALQMNTKPKEEIEMKTVKILAVAAGMAAVCGCMTSPVSFKAASAPVPPQGYTVMGSDVTGTSEQIWVFGFGGALSAQQHKAYKTAIGNANGADALVGMSIEHSSFNALPFFMMSTIRVTGTPVKFNSAPAK